MTTKVIFIIGYDENRTGNLCSILEKERYRPVLISSLSDVKERLDKQRGQVLLIDLDQITLDNRFLKALRKEFPDLGLIGLSSRRFHQELEEAMSRYIDACFEKSEDYEDLLYWLKAVFEPRSDGGGQRKGARL
jgi:DNA-binding NtrC family response regulator